MIQIKYKQYNKLNMDLFCTFYTTYLPESFSIYEIQPWWGTLWGEFPQAQIRLFCTETDTEVKS